MEQKQMEQKDDPERATSRSASPKKSAQAGSIGAEPAGTASGSAAGPNITTVTQRKQQYLIGIRTVPGFAPVSTESVLERFKQMDDVEIVRRLHPRGFQPLATANVSGAQDIIVARMDDRRGEALRQSAPPYLVVELDAPLGCAEMLLPGPLDRQLSEPVVPFPGRRREVRFRIVGNDGQPLARAGVYVYGSGFPVQGVTDSSGLASVATFDLDGVGAESIRAVYVKPAADHWERFIPNPSLDIDDVNVIRLNALNQALGNSAAKFPGERQYGWGQRMMKLDRLSADHGGAGVKIGLIDSGCDSTHPALGQVTRGVDLTRDSDPRDNGAGGWKSDELGQGTHCAGIIAGSSVQPSTSASHGAQGISGGISGFAPAAELHVFKLVPGGHFSDLIDALDQCIERQLDLVNLGICSGYGSELVAQKIAEARRNGVACISAAGNTGGPVQFPGTVPGVLTVSAVGKLNEFPPDTYHAQSGLPQLVPFTGLFATNFSCWGPQVGVCAPGVAVISSVPGGGYAAWDGTAIAAAHVTGFAALLLAHHPMFQGAFGSRGEQRISTLFELIRAAAVPYVQVDPLRVGAGLPDLQQVPAMLPTGPRLDTGAPTGFAQTTSLLANNPAALMQLRAAGLIL